MRVSNLVYREKKVDDVSKEHEEFEGTVKDALKLHDKLLKMGFEGLAEDALKIHDNMLGTTEKKTEPGIGRKTTKLEDLKAYNLLLAQLKEKGDTLKKSSLLLRDETGHAYGKLAVEKDGSENKLSKNEPFISESSEEDLQKDTENYRMFLQHIKGFIGFWLDENFVPIFIDGAVKEVTGYDKEDFHSMNLKWTELIITEDLQLFLEHIEWVKSNPNIYAEIEYRIQRKDGEIRWIRETTHILPENYKYEGAFQGFVRDINELKMAEESRMKLEEAHKREIHHRVKNNLQVISSLLDLQAEMLAGTNVCRTSKVLEAFKESKDRVATLALIHEELYRSKDTNFLDFSAYLKKLIPYLFDSYKRNNISLKLNLEQVSLGMDTAIPLGNSVTELISNALKHAFPDGNEGEISIFLCKKENYKQYIEKSEDIKTDSECKNIEDLQFVLVIKDNGTGFPKEINFKNTDSLGLQIVTILVEQIEGCIELERNEGTKFSIWFKDMVPLQK